MAACLGERGRGDGGGLAAEIVRADVVDRVGFRDRGEVVERYVVGEAPFDPVQRAGGFHDRADARRVGLRHRPCPQPPERRVEHRRRRRDQEQRRCGPLDQRRRHGVEEFAVRRPRPHLVAHDQRRAQAVDARPVRGDDAQQAAARVGPQLQMPNSEEILKGGMLRVAAHPLERDPGLRDTGGPDRDHRPGRRQEVVDGDLRGHRRLPAAARQDRAHLPGRPEVGGGDPAFMRLQRLADERAEILQAREPNLHRVRFGCRVCGSHTLHDTLRGYACAYLARWGMGRSR
jgi:hypothetical protein